ncbi:MAG: RsfS/YbeB/iojap family protein, partial [Ruminococcus sp.]|nr:RsfS/YbeB/iojap family protein [Ruminococcus sp.]
IIVHVFDKTQRQFYNLEGLWADASPVDISGLLIKE